MKMGNTVPRAGIEPTSLAFQASVLPFTPCKVPDVTTIPTPTCLCRSLPQRSVQATTLESLLMPTITFIQATALHIYVYIYTYIYEYTRYIYIYI